MSLSGRNHMELNTENVTVVQELEYSVFSCNISIFGYFLLSCSTG